MILLCLAMGLGSVSMAVARGQAVAMSKGGTTLVICTGYGVMTVTLDDQGNPVGPIHLCPDCIAGLASYLPPALPVIPPVSLRALNVGSVEAATQPRAAGVLLTRARGPPLRG